MSFTRRDALPSQNANWGLVAMDVRFDEVLAFVYVGLVISVPRHLKAFLSLEGRSPCF